MTDQITKAIDAYVIDKYQDAHRWHLGASKIGTPCKRQLWYSFRWVKAEKHESRMLRLFQRGHAEENRYYEYLRGIGFQIHQWSEPPQWDYDGVNDPFITKPGKQIRVTFIHGHFGGSCDGVVIPPQGFAIQSPMVPEFKTNATGQGFAKLFDDGVGKHKPEHFLQNSVYGFGLGLEYGLYMNTNKNDDHMYIETVRLDHAMAQQMVQKAEEIILAKEPPNKIAKSPTYKDCKMCQYTEICHLGKEIEQNCRSCSYAIPAEQAEWMCTHPRNGNQVIPRDFVPTGCDSYNPITGAKIIPINQVPATYQVEDVPLPK